MRRMGILYDRVLRYRKEPRNKADEIWNIDINMSCGSLKGVLILIKNAATQAPYQSDTEAFHNPQITKVEVTIEGRHIQLYAQGMRGYQQWGEVRKYFVEGCRHHPEVAVVAKDLELADVSLGEFLMRSHCLWLNMHMTDDGQLHGSGRHLNDTSQARVIHISKKPEATGPLNVYTYLIMDAQLNIEDGCFVTAIY